MGYVIFRNVSTQSLNGVEVAKMPSHKKASMRYTEYYVKGRDGALHVDEGYADFNLQVVLVLIKASATARQTVNAWADGTGKLVTSDNTSYAYMASVKDEVQWNRVAANGGFYDTATITFRCEPFMYEATDSVIEITESQNILNPGSADAYPLIKVEGSGDSIFSIAGIDVLIDDMTSNVPVYIDTANGYVYTASGATTMHGEIPYLPLGTIPVVIGTGVTKLTITPHWRWV